MKNLGYVVEVYNKKEWEENNTLICVAFITTAEQYRKFLLENETAEHYNDEVIDDITHMYYMV